MTNKEKINLIEEMLDVEANSFDEQTVLNEVSEWDSMAVISLIALLDEKFGKQVKSNQIRSFVTIGDIIKVME